MLNFLNYAIKHILTPKSPVKKGEREPFRGESVWWGDSRTASAVPPLKPTTATPHNSRVAVVGDKYWKREAVISSARWRRRRWHNNRYSPLSGWTPPWRSRCARLHLAIALSLTFINYWFRVYYTKYRSRTSKYYTASTNITVDGLIVPYQFLSVHIFDMGFEDYSV